jgi:hypothetical protein
MRFWFHCGRCGKLFQDAPGLRDDRVCSVCGADPRPPSVESAASEAAAAAARSARRREQSRRAHSRSSESRYLTLKLVVGWSLVLVVIIVVTSVLWAPSRDTTPAEADADISISDEDARLLQTATQECGRVFSGFIAAAAPEQRSQFVFSPATTAARMARFYSMNPIPSIQTETLRLTKSGILRLPGGERAFQTQWETHKGNIYDAVFRLENDEWRLDWDHFARYSDYPWALFIAGLGPDEGEFRLLARERLAEERKNEPDISIMLYSSRAGIPQEPGFQSPEFLVSRSETAGQLLDAAFRLARDGGSVYDSGHAEINPEGMIRVRVKARRHQEQNERKFEITEVLACHWYSVDDPGVQPLEPSSTAEEEVME